MSARYPRASKRCPTTDTIMEWCSSATAIEILRGRGIIYADEAERLHKREQARGDAAYTRLYQFDRCADLLGCERRADHDEFHYSESSGWWGYTDHGVSAS